MKNKEMKEIIDARIKERLEGKLLLTEAELDELRVLSDVRSDYDREDDSYQDILKMTIQSSVTLASLLMILKHEEVNVITSKGFSLFQKIIPFK